MPDEIRTVYTIPLIHLPEKDSPDVRRRLRKMAEPLKRGCVPFGSGYAAWPQGSLRYASRSEGKRHITVAWPNAFSVHVLLWEVSGEKRQQLEFTPIERMTADLP